jgi:hypothetical protein
MYLIEKILDILIYVIPIIITILIPISVIKTIVPYIFRPDMYGGIPWFEPSVYGIMITYYTSIIILSYINVFIFSGLRTLQSCKKINLWINMKNSLQIILWMIFGIILMNTILLPYGKSLLLQYITIPHSLQIVDGLMLSLFVLLGASVVGNKSVNDICKKN